jgi:uncharacterized membrane protein
MKFKALIVVILLIAVVVVVCSGFSYTSTPCTVKAETEPYFEVIARQSINDTSKFPRLYYIKDINGNEYIVVEDVKGVGITQVKDDAN